MLREVREDHENFTRVWTIDGKIFCLLNGGPKMTIDTPDDP